MYWGAESKCEPIINLSFLSLPIRRGESPTSDNFINVRPPWCREQQVPQAGPSLDRSQPPGPRSCLIQGTYEREGSGPGQRLVDGQENPVNNNL